MIQIDTNKRYLIAVSGGPDSMALFDMARLRWRAILEAAHMNYHQKGQRQIGMKNRQKLL